MNCYPKYRAPETVEIENRVWPTRRIVRTPILVPVDLRDGNQAFVNPMNVETKLRYFDMLCRIGFKEIEVAYPAASSEEFEFVRRLITENRIPDEVRIVVFTAARKDLIEKTMASIEGVRRAMVHCYIAGSELHREFVFGKTHEELVRIAADGTRMIADAIAERGLRGAVHYEFSPEEFSDSNIDFMVELCEAVRTEWRPRGKGDFILNLPSTVERRAPNEYADKIEYFCRKYSGMADTVISIHTHNDQGCAIAAAELAVLAGAERIEGTLAGHGERTGNMDLITFALNLKSRGVETGLDFSHLPEVTTFIEGVSGIKISPRTPYAGELVFTAFSGTHQDAIRKGMARRKEISDYFRQGWKMPYLHLDPADIGRSYEGLIRINSQSGKGGVAYVLESVYGISVPKGMQPVVARAVQNEAERTGREVTPADVHRIFHEKLVSPPNPGFEMLHFRMGRPASADEKTTEVEIEMSVDGKACRVSGTGGGPIEATVTAFRQCLDIPAIQVEEYHEHALGSGADARAIAFIGTKIGGKTVYGTGIDESINLAAIYALVNALNHSRD
ncbi:MAG: 2-isopropylmalate synthase [Lentisphaerae bacterium ADurb.Bin242]|nr:MAG: 2-isopropylmalate synthase [Lentisphaerae bacterium ADurb.Bin242]